MANLPTGAEVRRMIFNHIFSRGVRAGEIFDVMALNIELQQNGLRANEVASALDLMADEGLIENASSVKFMKLTEAGFTAM